VHNQSEAMPVRCLQRLDNMILLSVHSAESPVGSFGSATSQAPFALLSPYHSLQAEPSNVLLSMVIGPDGHNSKVRTGNSARHLLYVASR
jgi:hypothetical protein